MSFLRIPFMMLAMINLLAGLWAGLVRMGWNFPVAPLSVNHGAIMVGGFLTTLIALEKVVPLKKNFALVIPLISALSLLMAIPDYFQAGLYFLIAGSVGLLIIQSYYMYLYPGDISVKLMLVGACCLLVGNLMLIQRNFYPAAFPWWMSFLLLTITGERLELSKFLPVGRNSKMLLLVLLAVFLVGVVMPFHGWGKYCSGISLLSIAIWMLKHDVMRIGLRKNGLVRFTSIALVLANGWLIVEGILLMVLPDGTLSYDMMVHVFFVGYVFSMIFAHGPIILPGVLGMTIKPYQPVLYAWLFLVQGSLVFRIVFDALGNLPGRKITGLFTVAGILLYFITMAVLVTQARLKPIPPAQH